MKALFRGDIAVFIPETDCEADFLGVIAGTNIYKTMPANVNGQGNCLEVTIAKISDDAKESSHGPC